MDRGTIGDKIREWVNNIGGYKIYELLSSPKAIDKFLNYNGNAILYLSLSNNQGVNIFAKHIIIIKPDMINCSRICQTIGRLRRPGNPNKRVHCSFIVGGQTAQLKSFYASCYCNPSWTISYQESPGIKFLLKCISIVKLLGCDDVQGLSLVDGCIIFDHERTVERYKQVIQWWNKNKDPHTILSIQRIRDLYL